MCPITFLKLNNGNLIGDILHDDCTSCKIFISTKRMKFLITVHARIYFFFFLSFLSRSLRTILRAITRHFTDHPFTVRNITVRLDKIIFSSGLWVIYGQTIFIVGREKDVGRCTRAFPFERKIKQLFMSSGL